jgi:ribosomal protein S18 acetylase RimI-like enzyme
VTVSVVFTVRRATNADGPRLWALNGITNIGATADPNAPLELPVPDRPPAAFPDLADVEGSFMGSDGEFVVVEAKGSIVGMGGFWPNTAAQVEVKRVRVHPALRRQGIGRLVMAELEDRALVAGFREAHLDTASNQPEAIIFYRALGYEEVGTESRPEWDWDLVYFLKRLASACRRR